jgi:broad specificity phosphatase PhoE
VARLHLVRHGQAAAGFTGHPDPGLSPLGRRQATQAASALAPLGPLPVVTSPLARTRETAEPFETQWSITATVDPRVAEIPSPVDDLEARGLWLADVMAGRWHRLDGSLQRWRVDVLAALAEWGQAGTDVVVTTHFIVVNVAIGAATGNDAVVVEVVDNASITVIDVGPDGALALVSVGATVGDTHVG